MAKVVHRLKRIFGRSAVEPIPPFKQFNDLNLLSPQELTELLLFFEHQQLMELVPDVQDKKVLLFSLAETDHFKEQILSKKPSVLIDFESDAEQKQFKPHLIKKTESYIKLKGELSALPLKSNIFDCLVMPCASLFQNNGEASYPSCFKTLSNGGRLIISVIHPTLELFLYNQNPSSNFRIRTSFQYYLNMLKDHHLYLENVVEAQVNQESRSFFIKSDDSSHFDDLLGIPLVLILRCVKFVRSE